MVILSDYKCIFIHIPKTAGESITKTLYSLPKRNHNSNLLNKKVWKHSKAMEIKKAIGDKLWNEYFTFAFVRNPWDLMVSSYNWWIQNAFIWEHFKSDIEKIKSLGSFNVFMHSKYGKEMINELKGNIFDWICDENNQIIVDFIGKFENLNQDWKKVCNIIGIKFIELKYENKSKHKNYREYYTSKTKQIIANRFHKSIERFKYKF